MLVFMWAGTQWVAFRLGFQPQLGEPWFDIWGLPFYLPLALLWWWYFYDAYTLSVFFEGGLIAASGGLLAAGFGAGSGRFGTFKTLRTSWSPEGSMERRNHWEKTSHSLLVGAILHVLYVENDKTLAGVASVLSDPRKPLNPL